MVVLAVILVVVLLLVAGGDEEPEREVPPSPTGVRPTATTASPGRPQEEGPEGDVQITSCAVDSLTNLARAELLITNRSSKPSNYIVQIEFVDASGRRLDEGYAATNNVAPGQQSSVAAQGLTQIDGPITCRIADVTRFAS
ncbi:FxLYD domain-containing protein [Streptomyces sp. TRM64462]|uniref:FxLYD domain-containing protein n=1 Tax=Streptomyces sp. TRM64462 TaxID=2741726 RepID=UPI00158660E9|nr:FxLYD domain-containing protein [Streptomyces sp. TRM64462]